MRPFLPLAFLALAATLPVSPPAANAQQPDGALPLHVTLTRRPPATQPAPDVKVAEKDAEEALAEIQARERRNELIRQLTERPFRRPDLDRDLIGGIQSRNLTDALRRR